MIFCFIGSECFAVGQQELRVCQIDNQLMNSKKLELLGRGNGSEVWAYGGEQRVVLKVVSGKNPREQVHLRNQFNLLQAVHHRNVVKSLRYRENVTFEGNKTDKQPVSANNNILVLEHANRGTLLQHLKLIDIHHRREAFRQLATGLAYLHQEGIAHRDIKLENVLVFQELHSQATFKLSDFGFATYISDSASSVDYKGTRKGYMAPEIHRCKTDKTKPYDPLKTDIFALGVVLFAMVFNHLPFEYAQEADPLYGLIKNKKFEAFWAHHKAGRFEEEGGFRMQQMKDLFQRMVDFEPQERPGMSEVLKHPWLSK